MQTTIRISINALAVAAALALATAGCHRHDDAHAAAGTTTTAAGHHHEHTPPHGGTPVVLGDEAFHLELVRDAGAGKLQIYVMDGELENFIRIPAASISITATVNGQPQALVFRPVASEATGETAGDTSLFEAEAGWIGTKAADDFDATLETITIKGTAFNNVKFNYPKGNEDDDDDDHGEHEHKH
ncbi:MAG: hypothetical protein LBK99_11495 [Opitutaceae bacterium]|jgi:hypothetical protein|nr:hypothetical protein [Opitutaceae bacterium]